MHISQDPVVWGNIIDFEDLPPLITLSSMTDHAERRGILTLNALVILRAVG